MSYVCVLNLYTFLSWASPVFNRLRGRRLRLIRVAVFFGILRLRLFLFPHSFFVFDHYEPTHDLYRRRESSSCNGLFSLLYIYVVYGEFSFVSNFILPFPLRLNLETTSRKWLLQVLPSLSPPSLTPLSLTPTSTFGSLRLGRATQPVVARLIRFWDSRNINKNNGFTGITIILLDELARIVLILFYVPSYVKTS